MDPEDVRKFLHKYSMVGDEKFYNFLVKFSLDQRSIPDERSSALKLMDYHAVFLKLYRKEGDEIYADIARVFRKAAHKVFRVLCRRGLESRNNIFLYLL